jgi:hypothetical protein
MHSAPNNFEIVQTLRRMSVNLCAGAVLLMTCVPLSFAQQPGQPIFSSPEKASDALFAAVRSNDEPSITRILGGNKELATSGDEQEDKRDRRQFVEKYQEMHRFATEPGGTMVLYIGAENWPFPLPLAAKDGRWYFDSDAGAEEIFFRQIGENETTAITTCRALSSGSQQLNKLPTPLHGYRFRAIPDQRAGGTSHTFMFVAYPAEYRSSGVMTFIATPDGHVYEQDLGPDTAKLAISLSQWQPDADWHLVDSDR